MLTFRTKLLASHVGLVVVVVLIAVLELNRSLGADLKQQLDLRLEQQAKGAAGWVGEGRRHTDKLAGRLANITDNDVTIFDKDGRVLGDSRGKTSVEDDRPEVKAAHEGQTGRATRFDKDTGETMHYVAVAAADGLVLRLSAPLSDIDATLKSMQRRLFFAAGLALVLALALGYFAARITAQPLRAMTSTAERIAQGDYDVEVASSSPDEMGVLSRSLTTLARQLKARIEDITTERDRLSAILAGMQEGVLVLSARNQVLLANPAAEEILRGPVTSLDAAPSNLRAFIEAQARRGEIGETEIETDGRAIALYVRPIEEGVIIVLRDMTRMRKLLSLRRDFVANVSHELRTPLTAIRGYTETMLEGTGDRRQFLEIVHRQATRLGRLVEDLLRLSELEARAPDQVKKERVEIAAIVKHVTDTVSARAAAVGSRLEVDVSGSVYADPLGLEQVLENLVDNAIKYGGKTVVVRGGPRDGRVVIEIADDGAGIDAEHLPRLFERFYRVDPGRSREKGGTGLGLAIVKHLVESMGGTIKVTSEKGKGTTFTLELPENRD